MNTATATAGFLLGIFGAAHCVTMCGGFAGLAQSRGSGPRPDVPSSKLVRTPNKEEWRAPSVVLPIIGALSVGRVGAYVFGGTIAGAIGAVAGRNVARGQAALELVSAVLLLGVGLFLLGAFPAYARLEKLGAPLFRRMEPLARRLLPLRSPGEAAVFGVVWGFVPCGLVYSGLGLAAASGSALAGATTMLAFGAGTLPAVLAMGIVAESVAAAVRKVFVRRIAGLALLAFGLLHLSNAAQRIGDERPACCANEAHAMHP